MGYNFIDCDRDQLFLLPPFLRRYRFDGWGRAAYPPKMMVV